MKLSSQVTTAVSPTSEAGYVKKEFVSGSYTETDAPERNYNTPSGLLVGGYSTAVEEYRLSAYSYPGYIFDYWITEFKPGTGAFVFFKDSNFESALKVLREAGKITKDQTATNWQSSAVVSYVSPPKSISGGGSISFSEYRTHFKKTAVFAETVILTIAFEHGSVHLAGRMKNNALEISEEQNLSVFGNVEFRINTVATITATPDEGYYFAGFAGAIEGTVNDARVMMDTDKEITAIFKPMANVNIKIIGNGSVIK